MEFHPEFAFAVILGSYWDKVGHYKDNGKENGNSYSMHKSAGVVGTVGSGGAAR